MTARLARVTAPPISRYPVPKLEDLPDDIRARMLEVQEKAGFIPNVFLALAHRPDEFRAFFAYHDALMLRDSGLTKAEREMIVVAVAGANDCLYCFVAHGAILRVYAKQPLVADQVGVNYRKADITPRQKAMLAFALKVSERSGEIDDDDYAALRTHGFSDEDIWDIGNISAFFCLSNRMANLISLRPNDEFFTLGRDCRDTSSVRFLRLVDDLPGDDRRAHFAAHFEADERRVLALALERRRLDPPVALRIEDADVRGRADAEVPGVAAEHGRRLRR